MTDGLDVIYFDPESLDYHSGHARIFAARARADGRIRSMHFALPESFTEVAPDLLTMIDQSPRLSREFIDADLARRIQTGGSTSREYGKMRWGEARRLLESRPGATLFTSQIDDMLSGAALDRKPVPGFVTGVVHFCAPAIFSESALTRLKLSSKYFLSKRAEIPIVFTFDQVFMKRAPRLISFNWRFVHDPLPLKDAQFERLMTAPPPPPKQRVEFLVFGSIARRKGIFEILEAVRALPREITGKLRVRFFGAFFGLDFDRFTRELEETNAETSAELYFENRFADEDELIDALIRCDVMLATRRNHEGVSNNIIWAAAAGRPIISQDTGWMGYMARKHALGLTCDALDPAAVGAAMQTAMDPAWRAAFDTAGPRELARGYTPDNFYNAIIDGIAAFQPRARRALAVQ